MGLLLTFPAWCRFWFLGLLSGGFRWSFGGCFSGVSPERGENEWGFGLPELDLGEKKNPIFKP
ncbi:hypothetical protein RDI58_014839 [Solanum bulbocastanum]|uniref:Uncharacterized protein n=1 Tax=Solanum bulbocastanum TaxID=147425 RepID=A0AAN8TE65_SOLBU